MSSMSDSCVLSKFTIERMISFARNLRVYTILCYWCLYWTAWRGRLLVLSIRYIYIRVSFLIMVIYFYNNVAAMLPQSEGNPCWRGCEQLIELLNLKYPRSLLYNTFSNLVVYRVISFYLFFNYCILNFLRPLKIVHVHIHVIVTPFLNYLGSN